MGIAKYQLLSNALYIVLKENSYANFPEICMTKGISYLSRLTRHHFFSQKQFTVQHQQTFGISSG